ncbi:MAG: CHAT domain-containing protein [Holophagales bacterium]|nr:CHAT domain-containing protein [Holophagales bacterium]
MVPPPSTRASFRQAEPLDVALTGSSRISLRGCDGTRVDAPTHLDSELFQRLEEARDDLELYGGLLFDALLPPSSKTRAAYRRALDEARQKEKRLRLRFYLSLEEARLHSLRWEALYDRERKAAVARDPETTFSRYAPLGLPDALPLGPSVRPRLLLAVASPEDVGRHGMTFFDREGMYEQLETAAKPLCGSLEYDRLEPPCTLNRLRSALATGRYHMLHLVAHGYIESGSGILVLENRDRQCAFADEELLSEAFLGVQSLRLVTLMTCRGGEQSNGDPMSGLGRRLVERGLPAVVSLADWVKLTTAEEYARHLYESLARDPRIDVAVNEVRHQLFLRDPQSPRWSDPILYMHLRDGALWRFEDVLGTDRSPVEEDQADADLGSSGIQVSNHYSPIGNQVVISRGSAHFKIDTTEPPASPKDRG